MLCFTWGVQADCPASHRVLELPANLCDFPEEDPIVGGLLREQQALVQAAQARVLLRQAPVQLCNLGIKTSPQPPPLLQAVLQGWLNPSGVLMFWKLCFDSFLSDSNMSKHTRRCCLGLQAKSCWERIRELKSSPAHSQPDHSKPCHSKLSGISHCLNVGLENKYYRSTSENVSNNERILGMCPELNSSQLKLLSDPHLSSPCVSICCL